LPGLDREARKGSVGQRTQPGAAGYGRSARRDPDAGGRVPAEAAGKSREGNRAGPCLVRLLRRIGLLDLAASFPSDSDRAKVQEQPDPPPGLPLGAQIQRRSGRKQLARHGGRDASGQFLSTACVTITRPIAESFDR
jgi:hypothetical protein